jgi:signal transduction histidine kinase/CheY-like chemotaxis protein
MLLKNNLSTLWLMNLVSATFFILLLFDVIMSLILLIIGSFFGFLSFVLSGSILSNPPGSLHLIEIIATFIPVIIIGGIFSRNKQVIEESSHAKTEFIANMSHDIRTPLTGIINFSHYLKEQDKLSGATRKELAEDIYLASEQLLSLLNNVLEVVSADKATDSDVVPKSFDLLKMIEDLIQLEKPAIRSHDLEIKQSIDPNIPRYIVSDKTKLQRILINLIGNAIKFTEKGYIELAADLHKINAKKATIIFSVRDTGIGISEEDQKQIFERFFRISPSYRGQYLGSGIGLHIVQKYVQLLGGKIKVHSVFGKGTTFLVTFSFPIAKDPIESSEDKFYKKMITEKRQASAETSRTMTVSDIDSAIKIILVEDNLAALKSLKLLLMPFKLRVAEAQTAEEAFELIKNETFDLIITDIGLPGMQGDVLAEKIRQLEKEEVRKREQIVALTGHAVDGNMVEACKKAGIDEVFQKPMQPKNLETLLNSFNLKTKKLSEQHKTSEEKSIQSVGGKLGSDLPDTEAELFEINHHPILDLKIGKSILGSEELAKDILKNLKKDGIDPDLDSLKNAHDHGDWETVRALVHKIKGGSTIGTVRLHYALLYMERYIKAGHSHCVEELYSQMLQVIEETVDYLDKHL